MQHLIRDAEARLFAAGIGSARVDAELVLAHVLAVPRTALLTATAISTADADRFAELVERRANREPLQHIVGTAPFRHLELAVGPGVFIPRPETELLVDAALDVLEAGATVVDLCAGSGAIGLAVLDERPGTRVIAVEHGPAALPWLRRNAADTALEVVEGDVRDPNLLYALYGEADVVLSNPPYVPEGVTVDPEVRADPPDAVFAGGDGLALLPAVVARAAELLHVGGFLALEHDDSHAELAPLILATDGRWRDVAGHRDLTGRPRYTTAVRAEADLTDR